MNDLEITKENQKLLALTEHPAWGVFVKLVHADLEEMNSISSLMMTQSEQDLLREIQVRHHTILKVRSYINDTILRAESALLDVSEQDRGIIKYHSSSAGGN